MRKILIGTIMIMVFGCASGTATAVKSYITLQSDCPKNANCSIEIFNNKTLVVKQDEFGSNYYTLEDDLQKKVIKYHYSKIVKGEIQDAGYREEIIFELDNLNDQEFLDTNIQQTKMLFGRFCYCKGQTGNYKVKSGTFILKNKKATLDFTITEVPQIIKNIQFNIK